MDRVVQVHGYSAVTSVTGWGQVNGFELVFEGGGRLLYGKPTGRRESLHLGLNESLSRIAGRTDFGRRQHGAPSTEEKCCLVSLMFATSRGREIVFGLSHKTKDAGSFSFRAPYTQEIIGVHIHSPSVPIAVGIRTQPCKLASSTALQATPLVSRTKLDKSAGDLAAAQKDETIALDSKQEGSAGQKLSTGMAKLNARMKAIVATVESMGKRVRSLRHSSGSISSGSGGLGALSAPSWWSQRPADGSPEAAAVSMSAELQRLESEQALVVQHLDSLIEMQTCKICLEAPIGGVLVPCGHLALCVGCAAHLKINSPCPFCRTPVASFALTFSV